MRHIKLDWVLVALQPAYAATANSAKSSSELLKILSILRIIMNASLRRRPARIFPHRVWRWGTGCLLPFRCLFPLRS